MDEDKSFGTIIREAREALRVANPDFSLRKFAASVGLSPTFLSKIENNEFDPPKAEKVIAIAEKLNLDPNELLAKAQKLNPELKRIVVEHQRELVSFLRTLDGRSSDEIRQMTEAAQKAVEGKGDDIHSN